MRQMAFSKVLTVVACVLMLCMSVPTLAVADQAQYIYDDLGRLAQVIDGQGNVATYTYDAVGNLFSIARNTGGVGASTITDITPNSGAAGATVTVSLTGTNLTGASLTTDNPGIAVSNVRTAATTVTASFTIAFSARVGATVVTVSTTTGSATTSFSVNASAPVVLTLSPTSGPVTRLVTITGNGFSSTAALNQIRFNGVLATTLSATATTLTTQVPSGATTGPVTVTVGGLTSNGVTFTVANAGPPPTLTAISPNIGSIQGGQQTTLTGTGFIAGTTVKIGNKQASVLTLVSAISMIVQVPASVVGPATVVVTNTNGDALIQNGYTYLAGPSQKLGTITPTMGLINIPRNTPVSVSFSRPVDRATMTTANFAFTQGATPVAGTFTFDFGDTVVTFRPTVTLAATTAYTLSLTQAIKSVDGVPLDGGFIGSFTTGTNSDTVSPTVTISPANGATNVPFNTSIVLTFSEPINPNTVNGATVVVVSQGEVRPGTITFGQQNTFAVFTPASPFFPTASATVTVLGQVTDMAGNALQGAAGVGTSVTSTFTTSSVADRLPPVVLQVVPFNNAAGISTRTSISVTFSESVNPTTISPTTFQVSSGGTPVAGTLSFGNLNQTVLFIPNNPLPPVSTVNIAISNVSDVVGNVMVLPFTSSFQTQSAIDNIRPSVVRPSPSSFTYQASPPTNANVPLNFKPMIAFDERINPSTVNSTTFTLGLTGVGPIPSTITVAADGLSATLTPSQALLPNTFYIVSWTAGIQDLVGNGLLNVGGSTFTTGPVATDVTPPTVLDASPRTGTQNLPVNAIVTVLFSEPVSFTSITQQTVVLSTGGVPVNTQFTLERNNTVLRIKPANLLQLQANKFYELTVTPGVLDLVGNPLAGTYGSSFTTGSVTDTAGPTTTTFAPAHLSTGISRQTIVSITFNEPVNPITITPTTVNIGSGAAGTMSLSPDLRTVTFTPTFPFFANTSISISVTGVEDLTGNTGSGGAFFTTAVAPGTVTANLPTTAAGTANPDLLFSDGVTTTTITVSNISGGSPVTLVPNGTVVGVLPFDTNVSFTGGGTIMDGTQSQADPRVRLFTTFGGSVTFTYRSPNVALPTSNGGGVSVVSVDTAGAPVKVIGSGRVTFVRGKTFLPSSNPSALLANGTSTGLMSLIVKDQFGNPIPAGDQAAVTFEPVYSLSSAAGGTMNGGIAAPDSRFRLFTAQTGGLIEFTYTAPPLAANQSATATVQVTEVDASGNIVTPISSGNGFTDHFSLNGTTGFTGPQPVVLALSPAHTQSGVGTNATIDALFSQSLDPTSVTSSTFSVTSGAAIPGAYSFLATNRGPNTLVRFTPTVPFAPSGTFTVAITVGIKNSAGIPLFGASTATFSTGTASDTTAPTVVQVTPPDGSLDIATNRLLTVEFSEPMNATRLDTTTFMVSAGGTPVSGRLAMATGPRGPNTLATFTPSQLLNATNLYAVTLTAGLLDTAGNPLASVSSNFTTGTGIDNFRPSVVSTSPPLSRFANDPNIASNVPLDAKIVIQFSELINPFTITSNSVQLTQSSVSSLVVPGTLTVSSDLRSVTLTPSQRLIPNAFHSLALSNSITDLAGNSLLPYLNTTFITGVDATDSTALTGTISPADGDSGVAINAPVVLKFSKSVAPTTITSATVVVTGSSGPILGTVTFEQNNRVVRWKPANLIQFAPNTPHSVSVSTGVTDLAGIPMTAGFSSSFTTGAGTDTTIPTVISSNPVNNATGISRVTTISVTMSEPINPATAVLGSTLLLSGPGATGIGFSISIPSSLSVSADRRTLTVVPAQPLFGNQTYSLSVSGVEDIAGNKANSNSFANFTTGVAAGTTLSSLPTSATVIANPTTLFADGLQTTTILVSNVSLSSGALVPNGTTIAVTADPAISGSSAGGVILGGTPSPSDPRFNLFTTVGGGFSLTYVTPNRPDLLAGGTGIVQLAGVDAAGTPARSSAGNLLIGSGNVTLVRGELVTSFFNPGNSGASALRANGTSVADVTLTLFKGNVPAPASSRLALTVDPVFAASAGGTINGGILANDPRFKIFTTLPDGTIEFSYTAPFLSSGTANVVFQAAAVDENGTILRQIGFQSFQGLLSLNATSGSISPQPVVIALSPAHSQSGVGTNARIVAKFSQPLDPATVSAATFSATSGFVAVNGTRTVSASERGPNTLVTFVPSAPLPANSSVVVAITGGIRNSVGEPLLLNSLSSATFSTGPGADTIAPTVIQLNPPNGIGAVGTNNVITVEFSEPINATTVTPATFSLTAGGVPVNGRVKVVTGPRGPNTQAIFTPDVLLGSLISYGVSVGTGITDTASNPLAAPFASSFGTGSGIDNFQPSLLSVSPQNGMTGVPLNTRVTIRFSEPINPLTVHSSTFNVAGGPYGFGVPGVTTIAPDLLSVTLTPAELLLPNTSYSVNVSSGNGSTVIRDLAGNALLAPSVSVALGSFTTGSGPADTTGLQVVLVSPADQHTAIPINSSVVIQFSEPVSAPSVTAQSITISAGGVPMPGTLTREQNNTMVRWTLASLTQFAANTVYTVTVGTSVTDLAGNPLSAPFTSTFTTGGGPDTVAPTVSSMTPLSGATNVPRSAVVELTFSEEIDPATIRLGSTFVGGTMSLTSGAETQGTLTFPLSDRRTIRYTPTFPLRAGQPYLLSLSGIEDIAGNKLTFFSQSFTTAVAPGTNVSLLPTSAVVSATPAQVFADGQTTTTVTLTNVVRTGILVPDGTVIGVTADPVFNSTSAGGTIIGGVPSAADPRIRLFTTLNGSVTLTYQSVNLPDSFANRTATIQVASVDAAGAPMVSLGTADVTLVRGSYAVATANPTALLANGSSYAEISISLTDLLGSTAVPVPSGVTYALTTEPVYDLTSVSGTLVGGTVAPDNRFKLFQTIPGGLLNLTYTAPVLAAGPSKRAVLQLAKVDRVGNVVQSFVYPFFTGDTSITVNGSTGSSSPQPVVLAISPANGQIGVGTNATIAAKFSLPLNRASVLLTGAGASFTVTQGFVNVPGSLAFSASERGPDTIVTFTPAAPFTINSSVAVTITAGIKSVSGEPLRAASSATFSIGLVADAVAPTVTQVNPVDGSGAVPTNSFVSAEFSEPINATTIDGTTFAVTAGGVPVAGRFTFSEGVRGKNSIVTFIPDQLLPPNTTHVLSLTNGVKDSSGNGVIPATVTFTTAGGTDNIVPTVLNSIPTSGAIGFPATGTPVTITLSEPVNPLTVNVNTVTGLGSAASPPTVVLSANNTVITVTPSQSLFAGAPYTVSFQGIRDVAGNPLGSTSISFSTVLAPGTTNLPTFATVAVNPPQVFANGLTTSQVTISNISLGSTLVPNGTLIAVTAAPAFSTSLGGTISGPSVGTSVDGRFLLFSTFGAQVVVTYTSPNLGLQDSGASGQGFVQVASIDLDTRPVRMIGSVNVSLMGANSALGVSTPTSLVANGTATATLTITVRDSASNLVPDGTRIGITAASVFTTSAGGTILGGTTSAVDPRIQVFTVTGGQGQITTTYRAGTSSGTAVIQNVTVDGNGLALRNLGQFFITLQ